MVSAVPHDPSDRRATKRGTFVSRGILETAGLPPLLATVVRPWVTAIETSTLGMRDEVAAVATGTAASLERRVVVLPALDVAITAAVAASRIFADALGSRGVGTADARATALAALVAVIEHLRTAEPSENTQSLGLGW